MGKKIVWVLAIGILVRLLLAFSTFHSDIQPFYFAGEVISKGNILNFYDYLSELPKDSPILSIYPTYLFNYPPLVYFFLGPINYLLSLPFGKDLMQSFIFNLPDLFGNLRLNWLLLTLKSVYLPFDIAIGFLLYKLLDKKLLAFTLWMFNPVNLYATYMMGQFDVIPTFLSVFALYLAVKKSRFFTAAFLLGLGASFKIFPFLFLIPLALLKEKWWERIKIVGIGAITYFATILPFINSSGFRATALVAGQTTKSLYAAIPISGGESIILFPLLVLFFYLVFYHREKNPESLWKKFFILLIIFFVFTHYHPQWLTWLTPFLIIDLVKSKLKSWLLVVLVFVSWLGQVTLFDPGLSVWLFAPIAPNLYGQVGIWQSLGVTLELNFMRSIFQTAFAGTAFYYIYRLWH